MARLTRLTGARRTKKYLVVDIESKDGPSKTKAGFTRPFMVGVYDGETYAEFRDDPQLGADNEWNERFFLPGGCVDRAMRYILSKKFVGRQIYAHNAGRFDYLHLMPWLMRVGEAYGCRFNLIPVASAIQVLDVWRVSETDAMFGVEPKKNRRWRFLDSIKLIPTSLDKAAKAFGFEGKLEHDLDLHEDDPHWTEYLEQDCRQLYHVLQKFHHYIEKVLEGEVGITAPATAVKTFRRSYMKVEVERSEESHAFVRESYVGGRVEPFEQRGENLFYFDINSSYPAAMLELMPVGEATYWQGQPPEHMQQTQLGFVRADVFIPDSVHIPPLPIRGSKKFGMPEKLIFPTGKLHGIWEWSELQMAMEYGAEIHRWHESWWYKPQPFFEDFVRTLYKYRDKSNPAYDDGLAQVIKILLNSTYGKFGMKTLRRTVYRWDDPDLPEGAEPANKDPDSYIWYADEEVDAPYIMPQVAARVTALGRVRLYRAMMEAQSRGGRVYYCDTDSVITDVPLPCSNELGALKDEYPEHSGKISGQFMGPKLYILGIHNDAGEETTLAAKAKGLGSRGKSEKEKLKNRRADIERLARGEQIILERLQKVGTLARGQFQSGPMMLSVPRELREQEGKRVIHADGSSSAYSVKMW